MYWTAFVFDRELPIRYSSAKKCMAKNPPKNSLFINRNFEMTVLLV